MRRLRHILDEFPHAASVRAISEAAEGGRTLDEIEAAADLKLRWREDSGMWLRRRWGHIFSDPELRNSLSWRAALRLCDAIGPERANSMACETLRDEWLNLGARPHEGPFAAWSIFAVWIDARSSEAQDGETFATEYWERDDHPYPRKLFADVPAARFRGPPQGTERIALPEICVQDFRFVAIVPDKKADQEPVPTEEKEDA